MLSRKILPGCAVISFILLLVGCGPRITKVDLDEQGNSVVTKAESRLITNTTIDRNSRPGQVTPKQVICAEPSPDVAQAISTALTAAVDIAGKGSGNIGISYAEAVVQLGERTTTIQLLRDQMYRACEAYANGAISGTTYTMIMSENNDAMVTLMLGENAAGAFGRSGAAVGGQASTVSYQRVEADKADLEAALKEVEATEKRIEDLEKQLVQQEENADDEMAEAEDAEENSEPDANQEQLEADEAMQEVSDTKAEIKQEKSKLRKAVENIQEVSESLTKSVAGFTTVQGVGGITAKPNPEIAKELVKLQKNFLDKGAIEEFFATCLVELGQNEITYEQQFLIDLKNSSNKEDQSGAEWDILKNAYGVVFPKYAKENSEEDIDANRDVNKLVFYSNGLLGTLEQVESINDAGFITPLNILTDILIRTEENHREKPLSKVARKQYEKAYENYRAYLNNSRQTWLSKKCGYWMKDFLKRDIKYRHIQKIEKIKNEALKIKAVPYTANAIKECGKMQDLELRQCLNAITLANAPSAISIPLSGASTTLNIPLPKITEFPRPDVKFEKFIKAYNPLAGSIANLPKPSVVPTDSTKPGNEQRNVKLAQLRKQRAELVSRIDKNQVNFKQLTAYHQAKGTTILRHSGTDIAGKSPEMLTIAYLDILRQFLQAKQAKPIDKKRLADLKQAHEQYRAPFHLYAGEAERQTEIVASVAAVTSKLDTEIKAFNQAVSVVPPEK